jgi:hypothetical protein
MGTFIISKMMNAPFSKPVFRLLVFCLAVLAETDLISPFTAWYYLGSQESLFNIRA